MVTFLGIVALGFFLGMRDATDPLIAVTTIAALRAIGHTVTIMALGSASFYLAS